MFEMQMLPRFKRGHVQINCISQRINATEQKMVKHVLGLKKNLFKYIKKCTSFTVALHILEVLRI